ncbi:formate/nitrite transporter FocA (FNT family) [Pontibacter ummariensis]|uniref:Formate/nitrite transporter FocA, FNT family n=1 Tax=Pontibacter ummariensis TaxID=1610492 RepID=A0A239I348_9BACT|nr:formate/nitrite transporter family protein [Pontibacter ummariensis]PRY10202.1 formate/nitrite transporter FocA (FNT family) [Pontibacter ummariensis]SNS88010.1 Formate/nitrite transporter FocA, FNT family [Pontibacter ummariensis]
MIEKEKEIAVDQQAKKLSSPSAKIIHKAILQEGEEELSRPSSALFWSGLAAGLAMGFSMIAEGLLLAYLPDEKWRPLVSNFGYSAGFLIVILGRQQLFTENTLTPILPLLHRMKVATFGNVLRLWTVVLIANLLGALLMSLAVAHTQTFDRHVLNAFAEIGHMAMKPGFVTTMLRGIFAGWLIALMVWLLPFAETSRIWVIILVTYLVGIGHFSHVIAGSVEIFTLAAMGQASWLSILTNYFVPALLGNILGGVTLVAALNHAQTISGKHTQEV